MDIIKRHIDFDEELSFSFEIPEKLDVYIVGGSALYLHNAIYRPTLDIDTFFK